MSSEIAIKAVGLGKAYNIYRKPIDRLKQMLWQGRRVFFEEYWALRDVSLEIRSGETVGIIGRNGSGKSTFLQCACGTLQPSCGELSVNGRVAALLELGAGFNPEFSGRENVFLAASILGLPTPEIERRLESILEFAGIGDFIDQPVKMYSSGMYARLAFAVASHVDADILIIDEILSVGDAAFTQKCMGYIREFKKNGTLLFVSHDTTSVINLCERVIWLDRGMVRAVGAPQDVCYEYLASIEAEKDTSDSFRIGGSRQRGDGKNRAVKDHRQEMLEQSTVRNVIEVFDFDPDAQWHGLRGATIASVTLLDESNRPLKVILGGEVVTIEIRARVDSELQQPIMGFYIKDRLGQRLFGDNTFLTCREHRISAQPGEMLSARFQFQLPFLPPGDYSITPAIANGTQDNHQQHHWIEDAVYFSVQSSHVVGGLVGIPMLSIALENQGPEAALPLASGAGG